MEHTIVTRMQNAYTLAFTLIPCSVVNANQVMLEMALYVVKTQTWMDGLMKTLRVLTMLPIIAKK